ncbi:helix-turn-helix transcriptional regulator [Thioalkalivibrio sp. ALMg9]|uniref:helix-turn-helix domain-containing protein n=1 Tax=Thioalkalivibrio sp. ALMg9 TaxID=1266912 RepID=UPI0009DA9165|nr:helix-turn-helix transcriptional regulator [Thioalkalivibrio sp. ALMg9]
MNARDEAKKTADPVDWHPADIVAALRKAGWSLRRLSQHHGYAPTVLRSALARPWPKAERLIAEAIGVDPASIWPSRQKRRRTRTCSSQDSTFPLNPDRKSAASDTNVNVDAA